MVFSYPDMLIVVNDDVLKKAQEKKDRDNEIALETLRHLSWSIRRNHHLVFIPSLNEASLKNLEACLNTNDLKALRFSYSKKQDLKVIRNILNYRIEVSFEHETALDGSIIKINPGRTNSLELFEECHLLTENIIDSSFYDYVALAYLKNNNIDAHTFKINYYPLQGGGVTTKQVFIFECKAGQHLCLSILDSDKKWPNHADLGDTASSLKREYEKYVGQSGKPIACHYYIMENTSEIENLIPPYILKYFSNTNQISFLNKESSALPWFDIKKGFDYQLLYNDDACREWKKVLPSMIDWNCIDKIKKESIDVCDFIKRIKSSGLKRVVDPWGSTILYTVLHPDTKHQCKYSLKNVDLNKLTPEQQKEWNTIGNIIFNWCCCFSKTVY